MKKFLLLPIFLVALYSTNMSAQCGQLSGIATIPQSNTSCVVFWDESDDALLYQSRVNGGPISSSGDVYRLVTNLVDPSTNTIEVRVKCLDGTFSAWSTASYYNAATAGGATCKAPSFSTDIENDCNNVRVWFRYVNNASTYQLRYQDFATLPGWTTLTTPIPRRWIYNLSSLAPTDIIYQLRASCPGGGFTVWGNINSFGIDCTPFAPAPNSSRASSNAFGTEMFVSPNPATDMLQIRATGTVATLDIISMNGAVVRTLSADDLNNVSVSNLPAGSYIVRAKMENGEVLNSKFVKQ